MQKFKWTLPIRPLMTTFNSLCGLYKKKAILTRFLLKNWNVFLKAHCDRNPQSTELVSTLESPISPSIHYNKQFSNCFHEFVKIQNL